MAVLCESSVQAPAEACRLSRPALAAPALALSAAAAARLAAAKRMLEMVARGGWGGWAT